MTYYDHDGSPLGLNEYIARSKADPHWRRVAETMVGERRVSTVLLSIDHGLGFGPPIIFETMTFPDQSICERYCFRADAEEGHARVVAQCEREAEADT